MMNTILLPYQGVTPDIGQNVFVAPNAAIIGDVKIGDDSSIWFNTTIRGDVNDVRIGARTNVQDGTVIHVSSTLQGTYIGDDVTIGHMALLHACSIGNAAFIGMQACVMDGAEVAELSMIAAGALVTPGKKIPSGELWGGRPARKMRDLTEDEIDYLKFSAGHYVRLAHQYLEL